MLKRTWFSHSPWNLGSISRVSRKYRKIVQNRDFSWTIVQGNLRFWSNFGFCLNSMKSTPNFKGITNIWFNLMTAQQLRSNCLLPVYFRKICIKLASELCSLYSSKDFKLALRKYMRAVQVLWLFKEFIAFDLHDRQNCVNQRGNA